MHKYLYDFDYINDCDGTLSNCANGYNEFINNFSEYLETKQNLKRTTRDKGIIEFNGNNYPNGIKDCGHSSPWYGWCYYCGDWQMKKTCNSEVPTSDGWGCLSRIIEDGWQIKYF